MRDAATLTIIGSGTLRPSPVRGSPSHLVEAGRTRVLLDVGAGAVHNLARQGKPWWDVSHVVLSHYHVDHLGGLPHLLFALRWGSPEPRTRPLTIIGPPGLETRIHHLSEAFGSFFRTQDFPVVYRELARDAEWEDGELSLALWPSRHTEASVAMRIMGPGWTLGYTGDTGPEPSLGPFLSGCDVLICECKIPDPPAADNHLSPAGVADLARAARPGLLITTHVFPPLRPQRVPGLIAAAGYGGAVVCGEDGLTVPLARS